MAGKVRTIYKQFKSPDFIPVPVPRPPTLLQPKRERERNREQRKQTGHKTEGKNLLVAQHQVT